MQKGIFKKMTAFVMTLCMVLSSFAIVPAAETNAEAMGDVHLELRERRTNKPDEIVVDIVVTKNNLGYKDADGAYNGRKGCFQSKILFDKNKLHFVRSISDVDGIIFTDEQTANQKGFYKTLKNGFTGTVKGVYATAVFTIEPEAKGSTVIKFDMDPADGTFWEDVVENAEPMDLTVGPDLVIDVTPSYTVTYTDGVENEEVFPDQVYEDVKQGEATPDFEGSDPVRTGYIFDGWTPLVSETVTGDAVYTAVWKPQLYNIDVVNGAASVNGVPVNQASVGEQVKVVPNRPQAGYAFEKWTSEDIYFTDPAKQELNFTMPAKDVCVEAVYQKLPDHILVFDANGGTGEMKSVMITNGQSIRLPKCSFTPPENCEFRAWSINGREYQPGESLTLSGNVTAKAVWDQFYTITVKDGRASADRAKAGETVTLTADVPAGLNFLGWKVEQGGLELPNEKSVSFQMPAENIVVRALMTNPAQIPHKVEIIGGTANVSAAKQGDVITVTADRIPRGFAFAGWTCENGAKVAFKDAKAKKTTFVMPAEDVVIKANVSKAKYSVTVEGGFTLSKNAKPGAKVTVITLPFGKGKFMGWSADSADVEFKNSTSIFGSFIMPAKDVVITANYKKK